MHIISNTKVVQFVVLFCLTPSIYLTVYCISNYSISKGVMNTRQNKNVLKNIVGPKKLMKYSYKRHIKLSTINDSLTLMKMVFYI